MRVSGLIVLAPVHQGLMQQHISVEPATEEPLSPFFCHYKPGRDLGLQALEACKLTGCSLPGALLKLLPSVQIEGTQRQTQAKQAGLTGSNAAS